jgi:putative transcriptional regulator
MHDSVGQEASEELKALLAASKTDWARIQAMTGEEALRNALADPDNPPLTDEQLARMRKVPNPRQIREDLALTQREFATKFEIALGTLRDWEQGSRRPDSTAKAYLRVIQHDPGAVIAALAASRPSPTALPRESELPKTGTG